MIASHTRLKKLREAMSQAGIDLYLMQNTDPHQSEYLPDYWKQVEWLTGFRGEVANVVVTQEEALLWTDSRFFISGAEQLKGSPFTLKRMKVDETLDEWMATWCAEHESHVIGADRRVCFLGAHVDQDADLIAPLWKNRPDLPLHPVEIYPDTYSGEDTATRVGRVLTAIESQGANALWLSSLDDIAWTLNLRGSDIECTPVFIAYLLLRQEGSLLYIDERKLSAEVRDYLQGLNVAVKPYEEAATALAGLEADETVVLSEQNPVPLMKSIKNETEIAGFREAMVKDGIALTRFYHWLEDTLNSEGEFMLLPDGTFGISNEVTEVQCQQKLIDFRREQSLYREESFPAIVAWNAHGAMPHYEPKAETDVPISGDGLLLIDTGGQYLDGTTDITRTIGIGNVSEAMKRDYTLVLKGHIRLARAVFPVGTRGDQLDALARMDLWRDGKTYRHGTSHGIGHFLGVHEGPLSVRMEHNPQPLIDGMFLSNEPAIYLQDRYGIRHENCILVRPFLLSDAPDATPCEADEMGQFLKFETLTLCYLDTSCVLTEMLDRDEQAWLNDYNQWVYDTLAPRLSEEDREWLKGKCAPLN